MEAVKRRDTGVITVVANEIEIGLSVQPRPEPRQGEADAYTDLMLIIEFWSHTRMC